MQNKEFFRFVLCFRRCHAILTTSNLPIIAAIVLGNLALWLGGCAHEPPAGPVGPPPAIRLEPQLDLLRFKTSRDQVTTLLDSQGNAHVLIAAASTREIYHVVVSPSGEAQREQVAAERSLSSISAAFDHAGRLHLLLDDTHLLRKAEGWSASADTPWNAAGIEVHQPRLIQGRDGLVWTFLVDGKVVGAKGRWDWYLIGGAFAAVVVPWHSGSEKLVIVPEAGAEESFWYVLDPQDNRDARHIMSVADEHGRLYVVYGSSRTALATEEQPRYAQIQFEGGQAQAERLPASSTQGTTLYPVAGRQIVPLQFGLADLSHTAIAVDPTSGTLLLARAHQPAFVLAHGIWSPPLQLPQPHFWKPGLAPAGGNAFHLMTVDGAKVLYLLYTQDGWSAPVEIGQTSVAGAFGVLWNALGIASAGHNRAFLVWPIETGIVGRWIQGAREIEAKPRHDLVTLADGITIPSALSDFANGKVTLVMPGWTTGLAEAVAAGSHTSLAKQLHDSGQWESLASLVLGDNYGDDLRWHFLGRAAEGMEVCDAAEIYYRLSKQRSESLATRCCSIGTKACAGFTLPQVLEDRFRAIEDMRTAGKCLTPSPRAPHGAR